MFWTNAFASGNLPGPDDGTLPAWRRLWRREAGPQGQWSSGVTYRGYLGASDGVSAQWMSEQQMKETQALLRMAAEVGRLGAWSLELPSMRWLWSEEVKSIHGVTIDYEPSMDDVLGFYRADSQESVLSAMDRCIATGEPFDVELALEATGDREVWIHMIGEADRDSRGQVIRMHGAIQDISRFHQATEEARRMAERFTRTMEGLSDGLILLDHEWRMVYLNPEAGRILRRERDDLLGRCLLVEFPETAAGRFLERCQDAMENGGSVEFEKFYSPLGIWVYMKFSPSDIGMTLSIRDDTERINARRRIMQLQARVAELTGQLDGSRTQRVPTTRP